MADFLMPSLGADMTAGRLVRWRAHPGDRVSRGDIIADVDTEKGVIEVEVFRTGVVERLLIEEGTRVPVGTPLAVIREEGGPASPPAEAPAAAAAPVAAPATAAPLARVRVSPLARRRAADLGLDPSRIVGTGAGGAVTREDVERAATAPPPAPAAETGRAARMRAAIAAAVTRAKREIPHYYLATEVDLTAATDWLAGRNRDRPVGERLALSVLQLKAAAKALRQYPELNGRWEDGRAVAEPAVHAGLVVSLRQGGLIVGTLRDAADRSLDDLGRATLDLVRRARTGQLRSSEVGGATFTVTILGDRGVDAVFGVIYPPQVAIVGFGTVGRRPRVVGDRVEARPACTLTLAADHRVSDAHRGGLYLAAVAALLQEPGGL